MFWSRGKTVCLLTGMIASFFLGVGCGGPPQVSPENRELVISLSTAISAKNPEWLASNVQLLEKRRAEGKCNDDEYKALSGIITQAKSGDWKSADEAIVRLRDAQEPTAEDLLKLQQRKLEGDHAVPKTLPTSRKRPSR